MSDVVVELRDVFRVHRTGQGDAAALQGAELDLRRGEVLCLLGPSGAGKSTLLRVVAGIDTPSAGTVRVLGTDIGRQPERARARFRHRYLGLLTQSFEGSLSSTLTVAQAVALPLALRGLARGDRGRRADELLEAVALTGQGHAQLTGLSGGERQRVALAAAIAHRPALLLADEPTGELDQKSAAMIRQLITGLARASRMTVLIASHDPAVASTADRAVTIAGEGSPKNEEEGAPCLWSTEEVGCGSHPPRASDRHSRDAPEVGSRRAISLSSPWGRIRSATFPWMREPRRRMAFPARLGRLLRWRSVPSGAAMDRDLSGARFCTE
jgi:putative ABC transport system ATP-binding protein